MANTAWPSASSAASASLERTQPEALFDVSDDDVLARSETPATSTGGGGEEGAACRDMWHVMYQQMGAGRMGGSRQYQRIHELRDKLKAEVCAAFHTSHSRMHA